MSRFQGKRLSRLVPYTPGEQPKDMKYVKLNTNESPFAPSEKAQAKAKEAAALLQLYPDPDCTALCEAFAKSVGVSPKNVIPGNGSDEILNFAFQAFCDEDLPANFPDISYGFYPVFAQLNGIPYREIPLREDFSIALEDYKTALGMIVIANPNAPTGLTLSRAEVEELLKAHPNSVVLIDEAYVDFGAETCIPLIEQYENLLVVQTFSKSRSMAGARLGFGIGSESLIADLNTIRYSTNPYNINRMTMAAGLGVLADEAYTQENLKTVIKNREETVNELKALGFTLTDSKANFIFAKHPDLSGEALYQGLKSRGVLVRHFKKPRISDYVRITVGSKAEMTALLTQIRAILEELK